MCVCVCVCACAGLCASRECVQVCERPERERELCCCRRIEYEAGNICLSLSYKCAGLMSCSRCGVAERVKKCVCALVRVCVPIDV